MLVLILGLLLFLGIHSVRIFADDWRTATVARMGLTRWKLIYTLVSVVGLVLLVWGYGVARANPVVLYVPPIWGRHLSSLLTLPAFVLVAAAYVPTGRIKAAIGHPMVAGVKLWALAHLLANGTLADVLLFGGFLVWAVLAFRAARARDRRDGTVRTGTFMGDAIAIVVGVVLWALMAFVLHQPITGVRPFG